MPVGPVWAPVHVSLKRNNKCKKHITMFNYKPFLLANCHIYVNELTLDVNVSMRIVKYDV